MPPPDLTPSLAAAYRRLGASGARVLLAVSGGADSMALLHGTARGALGIPVGIAVASLNHGLRSEGASEVALVRSQCEALGVPFFTETLTLAPGPALEARAREARYEALERLRQRAEADLIATAHTETDQAETVLMRLSRGRLAAGPGLDPRAARRGDSPDARGLPGTRCSRILESSRHPLRDRPDERRPALPPLAGAVRRDARASPAWWGRASIGRSPGSRSRQARTRPGWSSRRGARSAGSPSPTGASTAPRCSRSRGPSGAGRCARTSKERGLAVDAEVISGALEAAEARPPVRAPGEGGARHRGRSGAARARAARLAPAAPRAERVVTRRNGSSHPAPGRRRGPLRGSPATRREIGFGSAAVASASCRICSSICAFPERSGPGCAWSSSATAR